MRKNVVVKPLTRNALDPVAGIERVAGEARWSRAQFEKELSSQISRFFVLQKGCNILGYGGYWKVDEEAQITNLVISPAARRRGMGRLLLKHLLERAAAEGCRAVTLEVRGRNQAAQALYQKAGFAVQGRRPNVYTAPADDAVLMEKKL